MNKILKLKLGLLKIKCFRKFKDGSLETRDNITTFDVHEWIDEVFPDE